MKKAKSTITDAFETFVASPRDKDTNTVFGKALSEIMIEQRLKLAKGEANSTFNESIPFVASVTISYIREHGTFSSSTGNAASCD